MELAAIEGKSAKKEADLARLSQKIAKNQDALNISKSVGIELGIELDHV